MKHSRLRYVSMIIALIMITSTIAVFQAHALSTPWLGYVKPAYPDYAPSGMPDFDEKQLGFGSGSGSGVFTWCGPVAVANSLWWLDSEYESNVFANPVPPPTISDHFPLVTNYSSFDDHSSSNVMGLVVNLAYLMDTDGMQTHDGHVGTRWQDLENGTKYYIAQQNLTQYFEVHNQTFPDFSWLSSEILKCQDVELFLEFYQNVSGYWYPLTYPTSLESGHFVTCAGVNTTTSMVLISDPYQDAYEAGTAPGRSPVAHAIPHGSAVHNDAQYVSQDAYNVTRYTGPPPPPYGGQPVWELQGYLQTMPGFDKTWHTFIRAAVAVSPKVVPEWPGYIKPAYPDYAPSGMPDFDEKQNQFTSVPGQYTWCVPVAVANSLWWLDSEYESKVFANPVSPPNVSDHFSLVTSYSGLDDHDPNNVFGLVANLATLMDTDGIHLGDPHMGTRWTDIQSGIQQYLKQQGVAGMFEVHNQTFPTFTWIDNETEKCQDVELCLEFWQWTGGSWTEPSFPYDSPLQYGHCVTSAGVNPTASQVLVSDPYQDAYEAGTAPGRSPVAHAIPHGSAVHNDAQYVSQDAYTVLPYNFTQHGQPSPPGYPDTVWILQSYPAMGVPYVAFITGAVATSPAGVHDVAVTNITTCKDGCKPLRTVCQDYTAHVNVTVANLGNFSETFNVTAYANSTVIGSQTVSSLASGNQAVVALVWNTTGYAISNYTLSAHADVVSGDSNVTNNDLTDGIVKVTMAGDVNGDDKVDMKDIGLSARAFGTSYGQPNYNPNGDIDDNHKIDMKDIGISARQFGKHYP